MVVLNAKIRARKTHGVFLLDAEFELGSPLKMILRSELSSSELAGLSPILTLSIAQKMLHFPHQNFLNSTLAKLLTYAGLMKTFVMELPSCGG